MYVDEMRHALRAKSRGAWLLTGVTLGGFVLGLVVTVLRDVLVPKQFSRDSAKIWRIANNVDPDFTDRSFTPVALIYRHLGLADAPTLAALLGYGLAAAAIVAAIARSRKTDVTFIGATYIAMAFVVSAIYLGQYSKDVFVIPIVLLLLLLPRRVIWEVVAFAAIAAYAYWFRSYWAIVAVGYVVYRVVTWKQVRLRYLLLGGMVGAGLVGLAFHVALGRDPNHFRTHVLDTIQTEANTRIVPFSPLPQPWGGLVDVLTTYWSVLMPVALPFTAGVFYVVIAIGIAFARLTPLLAARSSRRWPSMDTDEGTIIRRSLSLLLAVGLVQAMFEPDYGSVLRHIAPLFPLAIAVIQCVRSGQRRTSDAVAWSWTGEGLPPLPRPNAEPFPTDVSRAEYRARRAAGSPSNPEAAR